MPRRTTTARVVAAAIVAGAALLAGPVAADANAPSADGVAVAHDPVTASEVAAVKKWGPKVNAAVVGAYAAERKADGKQPHRFFHAKTHFGLRATFHGKAEGANAGVFAAGNELPAVVRFSSGDPKIQKDSVPDLRGLAIKVDASGHELGPRNALPGGDDEGDEHSQDFIAASSSHGINSGGDKLSSGHFFARGADEARVVAALGDKVAAKAGGRSTIPSLFDLAAGFAQSFKIATSADKRSWRNWFGFHAPLLENIADAKKGGGHNNFFEIPAFSSQTPYSFQGKLVRYEYVPFLEGKDAAHKPEVEINPIHEHLIQFVNSQLYKVSSYTLNTLFGSQEPGHELKRAGVRVYAVYPPAGVDANNAQLNWKNPERKHIGTIEFDTSVGTLPDSFTESLSFNVWRGFEVHKPLGSINLVRRDLYKKASHERVQGEYSCPFSTAGRAVELEPVFPRHHPAVGGAATHP